MTLEYRVELQGAEAIQRKLDPKGLLAPAMKKLLNQAAVAIQRRAQIFSPVEYGRLRASWTRKMDIAQIPMWSKVGTTVRYAEPLEYSGKNPRGVGRIPFFRPAISESKADIDEALKEAATMIERYWGA